MSVEQHFSSMGRIGIDSETERVLFSHESAIEEYERQILRLEAATARMEVELARIRKIVGEEDSE
jgi:hypothetical protein